MTQKIAVNSKSTGKYEHKLINGRQHIVTSMISIVADSVMNSLAYPFAQIVESYPQLNNLHAPAGHPVVDGQHVSAFIPLAVNAYGVGGSVSNPRMEGAKVVNDLVFDIDIASKDSRGQEIIRRIEAGEQIGVSTGLNADIDQSRGTMSGNDYSGIVKNIEFDHVAVLLNETPAGDQTYTINSDVKLCNVGELISDKDQELISAVHNTYGKDAQLVERLTEQVAIILNSDNVLTLVGFKYNECQEIEFTGDDVPVEKIVEYKPLTNASTENEVNRMDLEKFVLALIANSNNEYTEADRERLMSLSETGLAAIVSNTAEITVEAATAVIEADGQFVNSVTQEQADAYTAALPALEALEADKVAKRETMTADIIANSKMTAEQLTEMADDVLESIAGELVTNQDYSLQAAGQTPCAVSITLHEGA